MAQRGCKEAMFPATALVTGVGPDAAYCTMSPFHHIAGVGNVQILFIDDTKLVDAKKYPKHAATQTCTNCQLFQGTPKDALGGCPLFAGKQVAGPGWCSAWAKKA